MSNIKNCPNIPFYGAPYADAGCVDGMLQDLDSDFEKDDPCPCPFCNGEQFVRWYSIWARVSWKEARVLKNSYREKYNH